MEMTSHAAARAQGGGARRARRLPWRTGVPANKAKLLRRCETITDMLTAALRKRFQAARPLRDADAESSAPTSLLLQCLLLEPELLVVSLARTDAHSSGLGSWPARSLAGLSCTDLEGDMPSSAYRKLLESFAYADAAPESGAACVDLGACPGGWTAALRRRGCTVTAVDRSPLAQYLMDDPLVTFVQASTQALWSTQLFLESLDSHALSLKSFPWIP